MFKLFGKFLCRCKSMRCLYEGRYDNWFEGWEGVFIDGFCSWYDKYNFVIFRLYWLRVNVSILMIVEIVVD